VRVSTAFNTMLGIAGASVTTIEFTPVGVVVGLRLRRRKLTCPAGGRPAPPTTDRPAGGGTWTWGRAGLFLQAEIRRLQCRACGRVRTEQVPWARPGARLTRDLEDLVSFLAQRCDKTTVARLLRISWASVDRAVIRVVTEALDPARLQGLFRIGVDEVSWRKGHRYLTVVADHDREGAIVWAAEGKDHAVLEAFYDELGPGGCAALHGVSLDMGGAYEKATTNKARHVRQCVDPFHVVKLANDAVEKARRWAWNEERRLRPPERRPRGRPRTNVPPPLDRPRWVKHTRWALLKDPGALSDAQLEILGTLRRDRSVLHRCWQLKEGLRDLYRLRRPDDAPRHLDWWLAWACRSRIPSFVALSKTIRANRDRILAAVELGLSNSKLEGLNSKIRLINHRGYGHHSAAAVIAMIYLCCGGITVQLPTER